MRPPLALILGLAQAALASQAPYAHAGPPDFPPAPPAPAPAAAEFAESLVSLLSASAEHTTFLRLAQRAKAVPMLAHMPAGTVFAPTDAAWDEWAGRHALGVRRANGRGGTGGPDGSLRRERVAGGVEGGKEDVVGESTDVLGAAGEPLHAGWLGQGGLADWLADDGDGDDDGRVARRVALGEDAGAARAAVDNQNWALRQHLLYHVLNYTLRPADLYADGRAPARGPGGADGSGSDGAGGVRARANVSTQTTLLFPHAEPPPLPPTPPPGPPWLPRADEAGLLGAHAQRLRLARAGSEQGDARGRVGVDWRGGGGAAVWDGAGWNVTNATAGGEGTRWARNGVVVGIDAVLDPPPSVDEVIRTTPELSYLARVLDADAPPGPVPALGSTPRLTVFAPADGAWDTLDAVERRYLEGGFGAEGVARIVAPGIVVDSKHVWWSDQLGSGENLTSVAGGNLSVAATDGRVTVNDTAVDVVDIFASNGVVHVVPHLLVPPDFALLNSVEKVLLSVNATRFVSLLQSANLSAAYLSGARGGARDGAYTILAPTDDAIDSLERQGAQWPTGQFWQHWGIWLGPGSDVGGWDAMRGAEGAAGLETGGGAGTAVVGPGGYSGEPVPDASPLAALLQYHILSGKLAPGDIKDGMLVGTEMRTSALGGARQRLKVDVSRRYADRGDSQVAKGEIRFGDASILGPPITSGKSIIYLVSSLLSPPLDVLQTAVSDLELSTFVAAVYAAGLDRAVRRNPATTYLMPRNAAFASLGLGMQYLLLPEGKDELRRVLRYHALDRVVYTPDVEPGRNVFKSVEGGDVVLERAPKSGVGGGGGGNGTRLWVRSPTKWPGHDSGEALPANGELRPAELTRADALTDTGAVHTLNRVVLPADVELSVAKLIRGSRQTTMAELMARAGLGWILDGREPSAAEVARAGLGGFVRAFDDEDGDAPGGGGNGTSGPLPPETANSLAWPAYTVLVPTDKAFARTNLSAFIDDPDALLKLLKLHIIPAQQPARAGAGAAASAVPASPPEDGMPLALADDAVFATLLSASSKYGDLAVRSTGDSGFIVGVRNARAGSAGDAARTGASGRASVRWRHPTAANVLAAPAPGVAKHAHAPPGDGAAAAELWSGGMTLGGGVVIVDAVLVPYEPGWFSQYGALVLAAAAALVLVLIAATSWAWWYTTRSKEYQPLEGEDVE